MPTTTIARIGQCKPGAQVGQLGVRDRVDDPEHREHECADHEHRELRQAEPLRGAGVEGHRERDDDPQHADPPGAAEGVGGVPEVTTASTTAIAAHDSPIMKSASPNVDSTPITHSSSHSTERPAPMISGRRTRGSGAAFAGACWGRGLTAAVALVLAAG